MLCMLCVVVVFGAHSLIDWTWYVPGDACVALLCAGWLAGRGELLRSPRLAGAPDTGTGAAQAGTPSATGWRARRGQRPSPTSVADGRCVVVLALLAAWSQWQPQRSEDARSQADAQLRSQRCARCDRAAHTAVSRDPLSVEALFALANVQQHSGHPALAQATLERAVRLQPSNPQAWLVLGRYDLVTGKPRAALKELQAAIYLDPQLISPEAVAAGRPRSDRSPQRLHPGAPGCPAPGSGECRRGGGGAREDQKRERTARASSSRRAPGGPPALRTLIASKREVAEQRGERLAAVVAKVVAARVEAARRTRAGRAPRAQARAGRGRGC